MKSIIPALLVLACAAPAFAAPPAGFEGRVEGLRKEIGVPGMAIAIVEDDKITLAKGFGIRALGSPAPVDADTIFPTGSTGKAFTVAALGDSRGSGQNRAGTTRSSTACPGFRCTTLG